MKLLDHFRLMTVRDPVEIKKEKKDKYFLSSLTLGEGSQARVQLGYDHKGNKYAIKVFNSSADPGFIQSEIEALKSNAKHGLKRSLKLVDTWAVNNSVCIVLPFLKGIELHQLVTENACSEVKAKRIFKKILLAVAELHKSGLAHLDLKLENIMVNEATEEITLIDFGFAQKIYSNKDKSSEVLLNKFCGSVHYTCPEIGRHEAFHGTKADVWALGVILYAMVASSFPFDGEDLMEVLQKIQTCDIEWPSHFSANLIHFITCMLRPNPEERWEPAQLLCHPWLCS